jgi:murein DD-endopeptidase MepM/ murein hydrolase activator NlpD
MDSAQAERLIKLMEQSIRLQQKANRQGKETKDNTAAAATGQRWLMVGGLVVWFLVLAIYQGFQAGSKGVQDFLFGADNSDRVEQGEVIKGYEVTSGFGARVAPDGSHGKGSTNHKGVDLATPVGVPLFAVGTSEVTCLEDPTGYGIYATVKSVTTGLEFLAGHLQGCQAGTHTDKQIWGFTGDSGNGTGAHLHWEQHEGGNPVQPQTVFLEWALTGERPNRAVPKAQKGLGSFADRIAAQESGGDPTVVNPIGAMGKYQFMPETLSAVSQRALGRVVSPAEFLANEALQDQLAKAYWADMEPVVKTKTSDPVEQCRMMASYHYSGDIALWNSPAPQGEYPSIAAYTAAICK